MCLGAAPWTRPLAAEVDSVFDDDAALTKEGKRGIFGLLVRSQRGPPRPRLLHIARTATALSTHANWPLVPPVCLLPCAAAGAFHDGVLLLPAFLAAQPTIKEKKAPSWRDLFKFRVRLWQQLPRLAPYWPARGCCGPRRVCLATAQCSDQIISCSMGWTSRLHTGMAAAGGNLPLMPCLFTSVPLVPGLLPAQAPRVLAGRSVDVLLTDQEWGRWVLAAPCRASVHACLRSPAAGVSQPWCVHSWFWGS